MSNALVTESISPAFCEGGVLKSPETGMSYRLGKVIGTGRFATVYACSDIWQNSLAVKAFKLEDEVGDVRAAALAEFQNLQRFRHPNILFAHELFELEGTPCLVFQRCWKSVYEFSQTETFDAQQWLLPIASQVLQALDFMHKAGYIHLDIYSDNVFVKETPCGESAHFVLGDMGLAQPVASLNHEQTYFADWIRAPESLEPETYGEIDHRIDLYHCGLFLLDLITGKSNTFSFDEVLAGAPREVALTLDVPHTFALEKVLRRQVKDRTATALEFWHDLNLCA